MIAVTSRLLLILAFLAKFKALDCHDYDGGNQLDFEPFSRHRHHQRRPTPIVLPQMEIEPIHVDEFDLPSDESDYYEDRKLRRFLAESSERWPRFEDIERLAGIAEWKRERWKDEAPGSTQLPLEGRFQKFTYRRVQAAGSKRNAIIAVSAVGPKD